MIKFFTEKLGIMHGFVSEKNTDGDEREHGEPHAQEGGSEALLYKFFPEHIQEVKNKEKDNGNYQRHAHAAFPDDGSEGCTNKKKHYTGHRKCKLAVPFNLM